VTVHHERRVKRNYHPLYTDTTCTHPSHHLHTPLAAPNNTYTTYLSSGRCNTCITTPTPSTPYLTDTRTKYQLNTTTYTYTHEMPAMFSAHYSTQRHYGSQILRFCSPLVTVQNTIRGSAHSFSPDDGHNNARNMLR
jgi:hypothetical protein